MTNINANAPQKIYLEELMSYKLLSYLRVETAKHKLHLHNKTYHHW